jgi:hypothetical protein
MLRGAAGQRVAALRHPWWHNPRTEAPVLFDKFVQLLFGAPHVVVSLAETILCTAHLLLAAALHVVKSIPALLARAFCSLQHLPVNILLELAAPLRPLVDLVHDFSLVHLPIHAIDYIVALPGNQATRHWHVRRRPPEKRLATARKWGHHSATAAREHNPE